jgi:hypothetical protein
MPATDRFATWLLGAVALNLVLNIVALFVEGVLPTTVLYPILLVYGGVQILRRGGGSLFLLVVAAVMLVVHVPFVTEALSSACVHPFDANRPCNEGLWVVYLGVAPVLLGVAAALAWWKQRVNARE